MPSGLPTLARRSLGIALRKLRQSKGMNRTQAAAAIGYSLQTLQRIEDGLQATKPIVVRGLCEVYGADAERMSFLCGLAVDGHRRGWWQSHLDGMQSQNPLLVETESEAVHIRTVENELIPGLLQTPEYVRQVQEANLPLPPGRAEAVRRLRMTRQERVFDRDDPPQMQFVFGRCALERLDGLPAPVGDRQKRRIAEVAKLDAVEIKIVDGMHAAMDGTFNIVTPRSYAGEQAPPYLAIHMSDGSRYVEDADVVSYYERIFESVWQMATRVEEHLK